MKEKVKFYRCPVCGNIIEVINGDVSRVKCCNQPLVLLNANTEDAALEKHVPVYEKENNEIIVKVGEVLHPMEEKHYITFITLVTDNNVIRFPYVKDSIIYEYCNLHGLWKKDVE